MKVKELKRHPVGIRYVKPDGTIGRRACQRCRRTAHITAVYCKHMDLEVRFCYEHAIEGALIESGP